MNSPFASIMGPTGPAGQQNEASNQLSGGTNNANVGAQSPKSNSEPPRSAVILPHPAASRQQSPEEQYLDPTVDLETLSIPFARFPGTKRVLPDREDACSGWPAFVEEVAPVSPPVIERKDQVPYYIAGTLKEAELKNERLREQRQKQGQSTIGKQRSSAHIEALGPAVFLDDDVDVFAREPALRALGAAAVIYSSYSFGFLKGDASEPAKGGRVVLCLNKRVAPSEYALIWDAFNHLLGGDFDEHGRSAALCYGRQRRSYHRIRCQEVTGHI
jgi:hypothetical protein